jgi:ribosome-binding factor A
MECRVEVAHCRDEQSEAANKETLDVLNKASGFLRHELGRRIKTRITPRLRFHYDKTNAYGNYMFGLIAEAVKDLPADEANKDDE